MSTMTVRLPESLHEQLKNLAKAEGISINQFLVVVAAENKFYRSRLLGSH